MSGRRPAAQLAGVVLATVIVAGCGNPTTGDAPVPAAAVTPGTSVTSVISVTPATSVAPVVSLPLVDLSQPPVADDADPAVRAGAVANFVDCEYGVWQGGWTADYGPLGSGPSPDAALATALRERVLALPDQGFVAAGRDEGRVVYTYDVAGRSKAAVIVADSATMDIVTADDWGVEAFASCDPAEFDVPGQEAFPMTVWQDADGNGVPTSSVTSYRGPEHCEWESVTYLALDGEQYISDPEQVFDGRDFVAPFDADAELPPDAIDTGYRRDGRHLWLSSDRTIAYVVTDSSTEAWPSSTDDFFCA